MGLYSTLEIGKQIKKNCPMEKFRTITKQQLLLIVELHEKWLTTKGAEGEKADLSRVDFRPIAKRRKEPGKDTINLGNYDLSSANLEGANLEKVDLSRSILKKANLKSAYLNDSYLNKTNLQGAKLSNANLQRAYSFKADLQGCNLLKANLRRATLRRVNLQNSNIRQADFKETILQDSNFKDTRGFQLIQFAGADLSGAKLPIESHSLNEALIVIENGTKIATRISIFILLLCIYSWLTIATTRDAGLITNSATSQLPITGTQLPILGYFMVAPVLLLCIYLYFIVYLLRLYENLADLPAFFPDGKPADKKIYPSIKTGLLRGFFYRLEKNKPPLFALQEVIAVLLVGLVPITLFLFQSSSLKCHNWIITTPQMILTTVSLFFFFRVTGAITSTFSYTREIKIQKTLINPYLLGSSFFVIVYSIIGIHGIPSLSIKPHHVFFAEGEMVSSAPGNWSAIKDTDLTLVKGARLHNSNLQYLEGKRAFLVRADLGEANLTKADLVESFLTGADIEGAILEGADLSKATANKADFSSSNLRHANLYMADLQDAVFDKTNLSGVNFRGATMTNTFLRFANITGANLENASLGKAIANNADFSNANLKNANLQETDLSAAIFKGANLEKADFTKATASNADFSNANLQSANLQNAKLGVTIFKRTKLENADLTKAIANSADFSNANLKNAIFRNTDLRGAIFIEADLRGANLQNAIIRNAIFFGAIINGADLRGASVYNSVGLTQEQIDTAITDTKTVLPEGLKHWLPSFPLTPLSHR